MYSTVESKQSIEFQSEYTHEQFELYFCPVVQFLQSMVGGGGTVHAIF